MISFDDDMDAAVKSVATAWNTRAHTPGSGHDAAVDAMLEAAEEVCDQAYNRIGGVSLRAVSDLRAFVIAYRNGANP